MGYSEDQLKKAQEAYRLQVESSGARTKDLLGQVDEVTRQSDIARHSDLLGNTGAKYGVAGLSEAGADVQATLDPRIVRAREQTKGMIEQKGFGDKYTQFFNYALDQYQAAGHTLQESNAFARQWAQEQMQMQYQSEDNARARDYATQRQGIANEYDTLNTDAKIASMDQQDPYVAAAIRAGLTGLGQYGVYKGLSAREDRRNAEMLKKLQAGRSTISANSNPDIVVSQGNAAEYRDPYNSISRANDYPENLRVQRW